MIDDVGMRRDGQTRSNSFTTGAIRVSAEATRAARPRELRFCRSFCLWIPKASRLQGCSRRRHEDCSTVLAIFRKTRVTAQEVELDRLGLRWLHGQIAEQEANRAGHHDRAEPEVDGPSDAAGHLEGNEIKRRDAYRADEGGDPECRDPLRSGLQPQH